MSTMLSIRLFPSAIGWLIAVTMASGADQVSISTNAGAVDLEWAFPGLLQSSSDLASWSTLPKAVTSSSVPVAGDAQFFRILPPSYPVVDTGQSLCYNTTSPISAPSAGAAFAGQDAQATGNAPSYQNNADGTITDVNTGLMWVKARGSKMTWANAVAGATSCNVGGHDDWRMPTIKELYSLILFTGVNGPSMTSTDGYVPFLDSTYFDFAYGSGVGSERVIDCQDWSATEYVSTTMVGDATVFGVNFADGRIKGYPKYMPGSNGSTGNQLYARYVRGNTDYGENQFINNGDGTITDEATCLMWSQSDSAIGMDWAAGLAWVESKNTASYLGYNDWRMPNVKELQSIVDYSRSPATTASAAIDPIFNCTQITNAGGQADYPFFWSCTTHIDGGTEKPAAYVCFGRALGWVQLPPNQTWQLLDVHGAGAQRSDFKSGNPANYPHGRGPQGDVVGIYNYVRLVRGGLRQSSP